MRKYSFTWIVYLLPACLLLFLFCLAGCEQAQKPDQGSQLAPEVSKYQQEPNIILYRSDSQKKEELQLEEYIKGVVAAEIGPQYPLEALKAQAIVARTTTLALLNYENGTRDKYGTDASDDHTEFQAYDNNRITPQISQAVDATRGQVLTHNGKFVYALFHSTSAGKTASIEEGFPKLKDVASAYIVPVDTDGLKNAPEKYRDWTVTVPRSKVKKIMGDKAGSLDDIKIGKKGPSGRTLTVAAGSASIATSALRQEIGFDKLYSTYFTSIGVEGNNVVFKGQGWGHGCGMEQWGAFTMSKEGKSAQDIVLHYYPGTRLTALYE